MRSVRSSVHAVVRLLLQQPAGWCRAVNVFYIGVSQDETLCHVSRTLRPERDLFETGLKGRLDELPRHYYPPFHGKLD